VRKIRGEAEVLLNVNSNLFSPKNNMNLMGCVKDAISGNFMLNESELSKEDASQLLYETGTGLVSLNKINAGVDVFSKLIPNEIKDSKEDYKGFKSGKGNVLKAADRVLGRDSAIELLRKVYALGTIFLSRTGFTLSTRDLDVPESVKERTKKIVESAELKTQKIIESYYDGSLELLPGKNSEETRELNILKVLNETRTEIGDVVKKGFPVDNLANKMISSGAGGSMLNITQIACSVGQQVLNGRRIDFGYTGRTLPFFKKGDLSPGAGGFIYNSFMKGLNPEEFFFGAMTGRDGLMDTALRTPKSGYLYRRLVNALQDLIMAYDGTVRDASNNIVQFKYGRDGIDISGAHKDEIVSPGEAIGIVTAQSFGESATQMILNVFHSAGVAEMQVTQGLPRIIEILDARKLPKTPSMEIYLDKTHNNENGARTIAEKIKEVKLKEVISDIAIDFGSKKIKIGVDLSRLKDAHISIEDAVSVLKEKNFSAKKLSEGITLDMSNEDFKEIYKTKEKIKEIILTGVKKIKQVLVVKRDKDYVILTAGSNLKDLMEFEGIDKDRILTNEIHEVAKVLGIEAARNIIIGEIEKVIISQGLAVDKKYHG
jgi:DNA-directed RNA polymerase beta' subunit